MTDSPGTPSAVPHTSDERTLAALAHASALLNFVLGGFGGIIAAAIIWLTHKEKSAWVAFHGLQSLVFQIISLYGAYQIYEGREFRYKWIGDWVERQSQKST